MTSNQDPIQNDSKPLDEGTQNLEAFEQYLGQTFNEADRDMWTDLVANEFYHRREFLDKLKNPNRDIYKDCGYPQTSELTAEKFLDLYERFSIATRAIDLPVDESWRKQPSVYESEDQNEVTDFEQAWKDLNKSLRPEESWYQDEEGSPIWEALKRADKLSRIGHYGIILFEFDDVGNEKPDGAGEITWSDPAPGYPTESEEDKKGYVTNRLRKASKETRSNEKVELIGIRTFDESHGWVSAWETNEFHPRYGRPSEYTLRIGDQEYVNGGLTATTKNEHDVKVHWSRVLHIADGLMTSEYIGTPACQPIANDLMDLQKIYGSGAEGYWRMAFPGLSFETHPSLGGKANVNIDSTRDQIQKYQDTLQRWILTAGGSVKTISGNVQDPTQHIERILESICIYLGCPVRIFKGSERGQLASTQDKDSWDERMVLRQHDHITPRIIVPFVDKLIKTGVLPVPKGYSVEWPDLTTLSKAAKMQAVGAMIDAIVKYISGGADTLLSPQFFLTKILEFSQEEANEILDAAEEHLEEKDEETTKKQEEAAKQQQKMQEEMGVPAPPTPPVPGQLIPSGEPEDKEEDDKEVPPVAPKVVPPKVVPPKEDEEAKPVKKKKAK